MTDHNVRLEYVFGFTHDGLRANQRERLTDNQATVLQAQRRNYGLLLIVMCVVLIVIVVVSYAGMSINLENCFGAGILILAVLIALV